jgi:hypothetical protein
MNANAYLTIRFEGPEIKPGRMRLDDFIQAAREFSACAKRVALALHQTPSTAKGRRPEEIVAALSLDMVGFTHGSPAAVVSFERTDNQKLLELADFGEETYKALLEGVELAGGNGNVLPAGFDQGVLMKLRDIGKLFNKGVCRMEFTLNHRARPVIASFDLQKCDRIRQRIAQPEAQRQSIEGRLLMADFKETGRQLRIHPSAGAAIICKFPEGLSAEVEECVRQFVRVSGKMEYHPTGEPRLMNIADIEQIDTPATAPLNETGTSWSYDYWENLSAAEYARRQGVQPVSDFSALCGAGAAEDWEGFDAALEQWHAETPTR